MSNFGFMHKTLDERWSLIEQLDSETYEQESRATANPTIESYSNYYSSNVIPHSSSCSHCYSYDHDEPLCLYYESTYSSQIQPNFAIPPPYSLTCDVVHSNDHNFYPSYDCINYNEQCHAFNVHVFHDPVPILDSHSSMQSDSNSSCLYDYIPQFLDGFDNLIETSCKELKYLEKGGRQLQQLYDQIINLVKKCKSLEAQRYEKERAKTNAFEEPTTEVKDELEDDDVTIGSMDKGFVEAGYDPIEPVPICKSLTGTCSSYKEEVDALQRALYGEALVPHVSLHDTTVANV